MNNQNKMSRPLLITVLGPTASGKTAFAARLAHSLGGEIISADSRQIYRKMDIGTGKDYSDYIVEDTVIPSHLIDIADAGYKYSVFEYQRDFVEAWNEITGRDRQVILCGGSGMYIESVIDTYKLVDTPVDQALRKTLEAMTDDELREMLASFGPLHNVSDTSSRDRLVRAIEIAKHSGAGKALPFPEFDNLIFGLGSDRDDRRRRITGRLEARLEEGLVDEVKKLLESGITPDELIFYGLEYKFVTLYITGNITYGEMKEKLNTAIHQFAKRQMTWFRRMERKGHTIHWLDHIDGMEERLVAALNLI
jgi:tRNA dimethylallyltransferase